ncbi:hypothetical protein [Oceanispirochaeta sp. M1]|uniref:hypothetical protein n=2 Tax=Oceanispirochaeta TaxID=2035349 RepID=UPI000E18C730|nr:hypothetical protein [Oceanispirochaeta sp. M1]RDG28855.1 hypothetical protein DV872_24700 [Oceanispirochaeta sp. M1]
MKQIQLIQVRPFGRILTGMFIFVLFFTGAGCFPLSAINTGDESPFDLYGYLINYAGAELKTGNLGYVLYLRLKGDWNPHENLSFHLETAYTGSLGNQNVWAIYNDYGLLPFDPADIPTFDYVQSFDVDHAWARWTAGSFDLQFGKIPIAWGTGYVFNPSSRAHSSAFLDIVREETPGTFAIAPSWAPSWWLSLETYAAFQEKTHKSLVKLSDGHVSNLPWGVRLKTLVGPADLAVGVLREVADYSGEGESEDGYYVLFDSIVTFLGMGIYTENAFLLPDAGEKGWTAWEALEGVLGVEWPVPGVDVIIRGEYFHQGSGVTDKNAYNIANLFSGRQALLAEDYFFAGVEWGFLTDGRLDLASLINLNDGSAAFIPILSWDFLTDFTVQTGVYLFLGEKDTEYGGETVTAAGSIDMTQPQYFIRMKASF